MASGCDVALGSNGVKREQMSWGTLKAERRRLRVRECAALLSGATRRGVGRRGGAAEEVTARLLSGRASIDARKTTKIESPG